MEKKIIVNPYFPRGLLINSDCAYRTFIKNGFYILPKLTVKSDDKRAKQPLDFKIIKKAKLLKIIKKTRFVRRLDIWKMMIGDKDFYFSASLYIAKKMSKIQYLSVDDYMKYKAGYKGAVTLWPKFMKHLKSVDYQVGVEPMSHAGVGYFLVGSADTSKIPNEIKLMTDFLHYLKKLEQVEISCPALGYSSYLARLWRFEKYPVLIKKFSISNPVCDQDKFTISFARLKKLKDLEIILRRSSTAELTRSVVDLIAQVHQLENLTFYFDKALDLDASIYEKMKSLTNLKKIKLEIGHENNLNILSSLENCPLRSVNLKVFLRSFGEIKVIVNFLINKKRKDIESLRLELLTPEELEGSVETLNELLRAIDCLENLTSLSLTVKPQTKSGEDKAQLFDENRILFQGLLTKKIPLKKFKISLNQPRIGREGYLGLLVLLKNSSETLERLGIDFGEYQPQEDSEILAIVEFIKDLKNIHSLKLRSLNVCSRQFLADLTEAIYQQKFLRRLILGNMGGDISGVEFTKGVKVILMKSGLQKFDCEISARDHISAWHMDVSDIRKANPSFINGPQKFMYLEKKQKAKW